MLSARLRGLALTLVLNAWGQQLAEAQERPDPEAEAAELPVVPTPPSTIPPPRSAAPPVRPPTAQADLSVCDGVEAIEPSAMPRQPVAPIAPLPELGVSTPDLLTAAIAVDSESDYGALIAFAPFRLTDVVGLWGINVSAAYDSESEITRLGLSYRADFAWLVPPELEYEAAATAVMRPEHAGAFAVAADTAARELTGASDEMRPLALQQLRRSLSGLLASTRDDEVRRRVRVVIGAIDAQLRPYCESLRDPARGPATPAAAAAGAIATEVRSAVQSSLPAAGATVPSLPDAYESAVRRLNDFSGSRMLPSLTLGYAGGLFTRDFQQTGTQYADASHSLTASLEWRVGVYFLLTASASYAWERDAPVDDIMTPASETAQIGQRRLGVSGRFLLPLPGGGLYDDYYLEHGYQRGIGVGVVWRRTDCDVALADAAACPNDGRFYDEIVAGTIDLEIEPEVRPRLQLGAVWRRTATVETQVGFAGQLLLAFSIDARD